MIILGLQSPNSSVNGKGIKIQGGTGEMGQPSRAPPALAEDPDSISSAYTVVHNHP